MGYRHKDRRPRLALWMLVALGDIALLLVSGGMAALFALLAVVAVTAAGVAAWRLSQRSALAGEKAAPVPMATRRRA